MIKHLRSKSKAIVALVLVLTIATTIVALPAVSAQPTKTTYAVIGATPNPVGVGQEVLIWLGITDPTAWPQPGWSGLTVTVERPDGTTETLGPLKTDTTGSTGTTYVPATEGTYYLQTHFPEQVMEYTSRGVLAGTVMKASSSEKLELVVQVEPREYWPGMPLPTEYWTRPIDAQLREWSSIAGNFLGFVAHPYKFAPYNDGPETSHILWAKPLVTGGLAGGELGPHAYECGDAYEGKFGEPVIIAGVLYYNRFEARMPTQEVVAVDLKTGEELWCRPLLDPDGVSRRLSFGQVFYWDSFNYHGVFAYLWTTADFGRTWHAYYPLTGDWVYSMTNVPPGTNIYGPKGEIYRRTVNLAEGWMSQWNSSRAVQPQLTGTVDDGSWRPHGNTYDATATGIDWNVTIPTGLPGSVNAVLEDRIIGTDTAWMSFTSYPIVMWGISTEPGREGTLLFNKTWVPPQPDLWINIAAVSLEDGVFVLTAKETRQFFGFSLDTGAQLWGPTEPKPMLDMFDITAGGYDLYVHASQCIAYGKLFSAGTGGVVAAFDAKNGSLLWTYEAVDEYTEILWGNNWPLRPAFITDGKIYLTHQEHSPIDPKPRGAPFICLDTENGDLIWELTIRGTWWGGPPIIGDSIIATMNTYDQRIYAIGKGPSATTVTASPKVSVHGSSVVIEGMVTDVSPGAKEYALTARFPNGVPAISDEDMSEWMKYVYQQFPVPADVEGVEVTLDTIDPNGNWIHIGTVTSDMSGMFKKMFTPEVLGEYTIIATFPGSESYYASYAETAIGVSEAPPALPVEEPEEAVDYTPMFLGLIAAIVVVAILVLYTLYTVRKRQ